MAATSADKTVETSLEKTVERTEELNMDLANGTSELGTNVKGEGLSDGSQVVESQEDQLDKIAKQIDDFDPSPIFDEKSASEVGFSGYLDDEKLIDTLIKESDNVVNESENKGQKKIKTSKGSKGKEKNGTNDSAMFNVETAENNEDMSASTESDGSPEGENNNEEKAAVKIEVSKNSKDKQSVQDTENNPPTKSTKSKKKEDKSIEHILKALSSLQTTEEKLAALCKKYADLHEEHRTVQSSSKQTQRKLTVTTREKDQLQAEHTKAVIAKSKLESLCRELQKHNQTIRQESLQRAKEEDEKRKEISQKFQTTIGEIQKQMQENHERNKLLREENSELSSKLKKFIEQYEAREKQVEKVIQHRELEQKLADAKLEQATAILMEEKGRSQKEKELLIIQSTEYMKKMQLKEAELGMYKERYEEFQSTIKKSEEMFGKFKVEMDKMTKRCRKMEKDSAQWKQKWENANRALLEMAEEKTKYDKERGLYMAKINKLESLCRAMQAERKAKLTVEKNELQAQLAKIGINDTPPDEDDSTLRDDPSTLPPLPADPFPFRGSPGTTDENNTETLPEKTDAIDSNETGECADTDSTAKQNFEEESNESCASEQTGETVIQQQATDQSDLT